MLPSGGAWPGCIWWMPSIDVVGHDFERALIWDEARRKDKIERAEVLEEERHADGGDQRGDARRIAQRLVGHAFDRDRPELRR